MSLLSKVASIFTVKETEPVNQPPKSSTYDSKYYGTQIYNPIIDDYWDGEKTPGELGAVKNTMPDHLRLRLRAYDLNLKTDIIKIITGKFFKWVVGTGMKLQSQPNKKVLSLFNVDEDFSEFTNNIEALFDVWANSKNSDYHRRDWLHMKAIDAFKSAFLGGDCLIILRVSPRYGVNVQVVDGQQIETPLDEALKVSGNKIVNGIEINARGEHVAFWVREESNTDDITITHKRIKAYNSNGNLVAWMLYGDKARIDHHRGVPVISSILEKVSKLDRFVEASVTKAEQTANVVYAFKHNSASTGENILSTSLLSNDEENDEESAYEKNGRTANELKQTTSGIVMNLTPDSDLISLSNPNETSFNEFFRAVFVCLCAAVDIPEEVALQKYEQNYSSSRAAINGWEYIVGIYRELMLVKKFYEPIYRYFAEYHIATNVIQLNSFQLLKQNRNFLAFEALLQARFTGAKMPHIDPLKEVKAVKEMVESMFISREQGTELLGLGDWKSNLDRIAEEKDLIEEKGLEVPAVNQNQNQNIVNNDTDENNE